MNKSDILMRIEALPLWDGAIKISPLNGGITNVNYRVDDTNRSYVVRVGTDIEEHHVMRFNELACNRAAHAAGFSPAVVYAEPELTILDFIKSNTLTPQEVRAPNMLPRVIDLIKRFHQKTIKHLRGPAMIFWVFHVIRDYGATLEAKGHKDMALVRELVKIGDELEISAAPFDMVLAHNDLLAANILDDGKRLWLIDFDYAGFNSPLFDLGGLASNNGFGEMQEIDMLETYFETPIKDELLYRFSAMKCASLLRETLWSMVSEHSSTLDFDYAHYSAENLARFRSAHENFINN